MKFLKKSFEILLILIFFCSFILPGLAASESIDTININVQLRCSVSTVHAGETVDISGYVTDFFDGKDATISLYFDSDAFEFVSGTGGRFLKQAEQEITSIRTPEGKPLKGLLTADSLMKNASTGKLFSATFRAKKDITVGGKMFQLKGSGYRYKFLGDNKFTVDNLIWIQLISTPVFITPIPHRYSEAWQMHDKIKHKKVCFCGAEEYEPHTFGEWQVDMPATAEQDGVQKRSCTVCAFEESKVIPRLPAETTQETEPPETTSDEKTPVETTADSAAQTTPDTSAEMPETTAPLTGEVMNCSGPDFRIAFAVAAAIIAVVVAIIVIVAVIRRKRKA